jgi:MFS family permease
MTDGQSPPTPPAAAADTNAVAAGDPPYYPASSVSIEKPTNVRYTVLAWACSLSMLTYVDRVCIKNVSGDMRSDLGLSKEEFGLVFSAFGLAYALFEVPSGWLGDRYGPRSVLTRIVLWWSLFTALTGLVWVSSFSLILLITIRFLFGMGEAGAYPNTARALRNWFPYSRRGLAQGLLWAFGRFGGALAPPLITVAAIPWGWRGAFITFGVMGALWVVGFVYFFRNSPAEHPRVNEAEREFIVGKSDDVAKAPLSWSAMMSSPNLWFLTVMYFCSNAGWCFFITWDVEYYKNVLHLQDTALLIASGAPLAFGGVACLTGGLLTDRQVRIWGRRWGRTAQGCVAYAFGGAFFLLALVVIDVPFLSVLCLCIAHFGKDFAMAVSWSTCIDIGHRYSGTVAGVMNGVGNMGTAVAPTVVGYLAGREGGDWRVALVFSAVLFFMASFCWLFINPRKVVVYNDEDRAMLKANGVLE